MNLDKALVGQYGVYQVASQLCWMGYNAVATSRNTKAVDLIVHNPRNAKAVGVQVKTMRQQLKDIKKDYIPVVNGMPAEPEKIEDKISSPFIFVYVPSGKEPTPRFFVVPSGDVFKLIKEGCIKYMEQKGHRLPPEEVGKNSQLLTITVERLEPYEGKWEMLGLETELE